MPSHCASLESRLAVRVPLAWTDWTQAHQPSGSAGGSCDGPSCSEGAGSVCPESTILGDRFLVTLAADVQNILDRPQIAASYSQVGETESADVLSGRV